MKTLEAVAIDNQIKLLESYDYVDLTILIPRGNIQRMIELTKCIFLSKKPTLVDFNHNAGQLFNVKIRVKWGNISKYFTQSIAVGYCHNAKIYRDLRVNSEFDAIITADKIRLYAFGEPKQRHRVIPSNGIYQNILGQKISLNKVFNKYIKLSSQYYRLIAIK